MKIPYVSTENTYFPSNDIPLGIISNGRKVREFEEAAAEYTGAKYAIATSSGTIGLYCLYRALDLSGKTIAMPSFTWISTAEAAHMANVKVDYLDICEDFCLDYTASVFYSAAVMVDCFGCPGRYGDINNQLIVDSAHSFGALYNGKKIGQFGHHVYSLSPTKVLVAGEGGLVTTNDENLADEIRSLRNWAGRMTEFNAACALRSLKNLPGVLDEKQEIAAIYRNFAQENGFGIQKIDSQHRSTFKDVAILLDFEHERDYLKKYLEDAGIETKIYFTPIHFNLALHKQWHRLPQTEDIFSRVLCLPSWPGVDYQYVIKKIEDFIKCQNGRKQKTRSAILRVI